MSQESLADRIQAAFGSIEPYRAGKSAAAAGGDAIRLSANENPLGAGAGARAALAAPDAPALHVYPDAAASRLREQLSEHTGVPAAGIVCGNGSNELIMLSAQLALRPGRKAIMSEHAFVLYRRAALACAAEPVEVAARDFGHDLQAMAEAAADPQADMVFIANPNNPTGSWHDADAIRTFVDRVPDRVLILLDEAYQEYTGEPQTVTPAWTQDIENLVVTRTFSKIHGLAGLRVGYAIACERICRIIDRIRQPFSVNALGLAAAAAAICDRQHISVSQQTNRTGMTQLAAGLANLGYPTMNSQANFIPFAAEDADEAFRLLAQGGVAVRQIGEYGLPGWLRVTVGTAETNDRFLSLLPPRRSS